MENKELSEGKLSVNDMVEKVMSERARYIESFINAIRYMVEQEGVAFTVDGFELVEEVNHNAMNQSQGKPVIQYRWYCRRRNNELQEKTS